MSSCLNIYFILTKIFVMPYVFFCLWYNDKINVQICCYTYSSKKIAVLSTTGVPNRCSPSSQTSTSPLPIGNWVMQVEGMAHKVPFSHTGH